MTGQPQAPRAVVMGPHYPYPPASGGVKRTLRILETIARAGAEVHYFTTEDPERGAADGLAALDLHAHVVPDGLDRPSDRIRQHLRRRPARHSSQLVARMADLEREGAAWVQVEGVTDSAYLLHRWTVPRILSAQNVDSNVMWMHAGSMPPRSVARLRERYHTHRFVRTERRVGAVADVVLCVSEQDAVHFRAVAPRVVVAPNGVDDRLFSVDPSLGPGEDIVFFGQMTYGPNLAGIRRFLAEGWPVLARLRPHARLVIAGQASRELLGDIAGPRVLVVGLVDDIADLLASARVVVVPIWVGGGTRLKVLETLAASRPLVGTTLGVAGVGFIDGAHGLTAETPADLAARVAELCEDTERARRLGAAGRELAQGFRWDRALAPAEAIFREYVERFAATQRGG